MMGSLLLTTAFILGFVVIQTTLVPLIAVKQIAPDLLLLYVVFRGIREGRTHGMILGFSAGLLQDLSGSGLPGPIALARTVAVFLACSLPVNPYEKNIWMVGAVLWTAAIVQQIIISIFTGGDSALGIFGMVFRYGIPSALYTFILGWIWAFAVQASTFRFRETRR